MVVVVDRASLIGGVLAVALLDGLLVEVAAILVDVADGEDLGVLLAEEAFDVVVAHGAHADVPDAQALGRRGLVLRPEHRGRNDHEGGHGRRGAQELAPGDVLEHPSSVHVDMKQ